ncbi:MAG: tetraacyldisaccharide 4'-kinase [Natronospirillum sp.]|uniref:tetraacyldisaccharide 4'-kinase n=1 Tax=Natronospirillum sp. TaxID=2812955 RepID=UPI0025E27FD0|nr:tetraacyldisaccharide 4'-kinase [Natronospirillum sp.]MCH8553305.1 tetraacyldisaccharide 4'-kinase [Natronospirillum sp.]
MSWPLHWQQVTPLTRLARPLAGLFARLSQHQKIKSLQQREALPVPVIIVGNIVVGGTGKTPMIAWLAGHLRALGCTPGIISRGHGGRKRGPWQVGATDKASEVGDEPLQLARQTGVPVCIGKNRLAAARYLLDREPEINVLISDDGLQHYRLPRDLELCLFDGQAGIGNGELLPAGPLREPLSRLNETDLVICKSQPVPDLARWDPLVMSLTAGELRPLSANQAGPSGKSTELPTPRTQDQAVVAVCGIGQPESFFQLLRRQGWAIEPMALPDHGALSKKQISALAGRTVLMTSKDAVKLKGRTLPCNAYEVPLQVAFSDSHLNRLSAALERVLGRQATVSDVESESSQRST